jgi:small GTP-binding protein
VERNAKISLATIRSPEKLSPSQFAPQMGSFLTPTITRRMEHPPIKVAIIGNTNVGKTSLVHRLACELNPDLPASPSTKNSFYQTTVDVDGVSVPLEIWDTAGQERYRALVRLPCRRCDIVLLTFAVDDRDSFNDLSKWAALVAEEADSLKAKIVIGNKVDLPTRSVTDEEAEAFTGELGFLGPIRTSAVTGVGMADLARALLQGASGPRARVSAFPDPNVEKECC